MALNLTSFAAMMKETYTKDKVNTLLYSDHPFLAMLKKNENFMGKSLEVPVIYGSPQNRSRTFATAQAGASTSLSKAFSITVKKDYGFAFIDNLTILSSKGKEGAFAEAMETEIDLAIKGVTRNLSRSLFRDSSGYIAQVNAEPAEAALVITLKSAADIVHFEVGMIINIWSAKSGGSQRNSDGSTTDLYVIAVDRDAGTVSLGYDATNAETYTSSGTIAANDYIFIKGDRGNAIEGLEGWLPASAPGATSFFGVDRSSDVTRLGGIRYDGSALPIEEALIEGASRVAREGGKPDVCIVNYANYANLEKSLGSKVQYVDLEMKDVKIGFRGIVIQGPRGPIKVVADADCPAQVAYMLQMDTWKLHSVGKAVDVFDTDGNASLRVSNEDSVEVRVVSYTQLSCSAPGFSARITLAS